MRARTRSVSFALVVSLGLLGEASAEAVSEGWRLVGHDKGVLISSRQLPGDSHPTFRGQATIRGSVLHVLAVVLDSPKSIHWVKGASEMEIVREVDGRTQFVQMITDLPWPIRDRDTLMKRTVDVLTPASQFRVRFQCAPGERKERPGKIRVQLCDSHFSLRAVEPDKTYVDYQVQIDPGGGLPDWSIHWMEKRITVDTISHLAKQVERTEGQYEGVMRRWTNER